MNYLTCIERYFQYRNSFITRSCVHIQNADAKRRIDVITCTQPYIPSWHFCLGAFWKYHFGIKYVLFSRNVNFERFSDMGSRSDRLFLMTSAIISVITVTFYGKDNFAPRVNITTHNVHSALLRGNMKIHDLYDHVLWYQRQNKESSSITYRSIPCFFLVHTFKNFFLPKNFLFWETRHPRWIVCYSSDKSL